MPLWSTALLTLTDVNVTYFCGPDLSCHDDVLALHKGGSLLLGVPHEMGRPSGDATLHAVIMALGSRWTRWHKMAQKLLVRLQ